MTSRPIVVALFGPTGIGKTAVAVALARLLRARGEKPVAVSADALQIYAGIEIVTGAPTIEERAELEHRMVGVLPVSETFSAGEYAKRAHGEIDTLLADGRRPIVVGGTGLYLRAALAELDLRPPPSAERRDFWRAELARCGSAALHSRLATLSARAAAAVAPTDSQRIVRSLELVEAGHLPLLAPHEPSQLWTADTRRPTVLIGLTMDRARLYERIEARVDAMIAAGAADEVRAALAAGASHTARRALGFEELLSGDVAAMKQRTRHYARRQLTWMRKLPQVELLDVTDREPADVAEEVLVAIDRLAPVRTR